jgi:hypothetical protein
VRVDKGSDALPELRLTVPSTVSPSKKVTGPVAAAGETAAVKVTGSAKVEVAALDVRVVVVSTCPTVKERAGEVLPPKEESPP